MAGACCHQVTEVNFNSDHTQTLTHRSLIAVSVGTTYCCLEAAPLRNADTDLFARASDD